MFYSCVCFFFFKQKTAYEMRISDWSSDVCSSDLQSARPKSCCALTRAWSWPRHDGDTAHARCNAGSHLLANAATTLWTLGVGHQPADGSTRGTGCGRDAVCDS